MTFSADIYELAVLFIAFAFIALVIAAIPMITQMKRTFRSLEELSTEGKKTVKSLDELTGEGKKAFEIINRFLTRTSEQTDDLEELFAKFKQIGFKIANLAELVVDGIKSPLITIMSLLMGVEFGMKRFIKKNTEGGSGNE